MNLQYFSFGEIKLFICTSCTDRTVVTFFEFWNTAYSSSDWFLLCNHVQSLYEQGWVPKFIEKRMLQPLCVHDCTSRCYKYTGSISIILERTTIDSNKAVHMSSWNIVSGTVCFLQFVFCSCTGCTSLRSVHCFLFPKWHQWHYFSANWMDI